MFVDELLVEQPNDCDFKQYENADDDCLYGDWQMVEIPGPIIDTSEE